MNTHQIVSSIPSSFLRQLRLSKSLCLLNILLVHDEASIACEQTSCEQLGLSIQLPSSRTGDLYTFLTLYLNLCITETTFTVVSYTLSTAVPIPTCISTSSQSATGNTMVAVLHDYTNSQVSCHRSF